MSRPLVDADGHRWPLTGFWCSSCGMPLACVLEAVGVHPTCDVGGDS